MSGERFIGFVPCRAGSERIERKNTRPFAGYTNGLLELKLRQLARVEIFEEILVSSNDPEVLDIAARFARDLDGRITPQERPEEWGSSDTSMSRFIREYIAFLRDEGVIMWTHVTSPLIRADDYRKIIDAYRLAIDEAHDCLVTVTKLQKFIWNSTGPLNYDPEIERWPRSQDLEPLFEINHGAYVMPFAVMRERQDRIGAKPLFHELPEAVAMDIDWPEQFFELEHKVRQAVDRGEAL